MTLSSPGAGHLGSPSTVTVRIIDSSALNFTVDTLPPTVAITTAATQNVNTGAVFNITGTAKDNKAVRKVQYSLNGAAFTDAVLSAPSLPSTGDGAPRSRRSRAPTR